MGNTKKAAKEKKTVDEVRTEAAAAKEEPMPAMETLPLEAVATDEVAVEEEEVPLKVLFIGPARRIRHGFSSRLYGANEILETVADELSDSQMAGFTLTEQKSCDLIEISDPTTAKTVIDTVISRLTTNTASIDDVHNSLNYLREKIARFEAKKLGGALNLSQYQKYASEIEDGILDAIVMENLRELQLKAARFADELEQDATVLLENNVVRAAREKTNLSESQVRAQIDKTWATAEEPVGALHKLRIALRDAQKKPSSARPLSSPVAQHVRQSGNGRVQ